MEVFNPFGAGNLRANNIFVLLGDLDFKDKQWVSFLVVDSFIGLS